MGGGGGFWGWPDLGEGALEHRTPGPDIPQQWAGKGSWGSGPEWMGGHIKYTPWLICMSCKLIARPIKRNKKFAHSLFIYARVEVKNVMAEEGKWGPSQAVIEHKKITGTGSNIFNLFRTWKTF